MWLPRITRCPHDDCRSTNLDRIEDEFLDNSVQELWQCWECKRHWSEVYRLESFRLLISDDEIENWGAPDE